MNGTSTDTDYKVTLDNKTFKYFLDVLDMMKKNTTFLVMENGNIIQKDDSTKLLYEVEFKNFNISFNVKNIKDFHSCLSSMFKTSDSISCIIEDNKNECVFLDENSKLEFRFKLPNSEFISNKFLTREEFESTIEPYMNNKILDIEITDQMYRSINSFSKISESNYIKIESKENDFVNLKLSTINDKNTKTINLKKLSSEHAKFTGSIAVPLEIFILKKTDIAFELYRKDQLTIGKSMIKLSDDFFINLWIRSKIL